MMPDTICRPTTTNTTSSGRVAKNEPAMASPTSTEMLRCSALMAIWTVWSFANANPGQGAQQRLTCGEGQRHDRAVQQ